jgi:hypothetical protein
MKKIIKNILKEYVDKSTGELIKDFLNNENNIFSESFVIPYDEEYVDVLIKYEIDKVNVWKASIYEPELEYEGTVYISIEKILIGNKETNSWEIAERDDIPEWVWDSLQDNISDVVRKWFSAGVDVDITF